MQVLGGPEVQQVQAELRTCRLQHARQHAELPVGGGLARMQAEMQDIGREVGQTGC